MKEIFKVSSNLTKDMLYEVGIDVFESDIFKERLLLAIIGAIGIVGVTWYFREVTIKTILLAMIDIIAIWKLKSLTGYIYMKKYEKLLQTQTILFYEEYFRVKYETTNKELDFKYFDIEKLKETEKAFLLTMGERVLWFDKSSFIKGDLESFRSFTREKVSSDIIKLK